VSKSATVKTERHVFRTKVGVFSICRNYDAGARDSPTLGKKFNAVPSDRESDWVMH
jgi:hypothetical protein